MTIGEAAKELAAEMSKEGVTGVFILEYALQELLEVRGHAKFLKLSDGTLLHDTPGYRRLQAQDAEQLERIQKLLAEFKGEVAELKGPVGI
jgi:hypothetical protein